MHDTLSRLLNMQQGEPFGSSLVAVAADVRRADNGSLALALVSTGASAGAAPVTEQRSVGAFSAVDVTGPYKVVVRAQGQQSGHAEGNEALVRTCVLVFHFSGSLGSMEASVLRGAGLACQRDASERPPRCPWSGRTSPLRQSRALDRPAARVRAADPDLELVEVHITHAEYWDVKESKTTQLFKMAKAAVTGERPVMGEHREFEPH